MPKNSEIANLKNILISITFLSIVEEAQPFPAREWLTPSEPPAGRSRLEADKQFEALPRAPLKKLFEKSFFRNFKNF
jgi:hypothetical protein